MFHLKPSAHPSTSPDHSTHIRSGVTQMQPRVSRHAKCYRAIYRRARNRVTHHRSMAMGGTRVGPQANREYLERMRERYEQASRAEKGPLLDEVCEVTGYHRKAVIRREGCINPERVFPAGV